MKLYDMVLVLGMRLPAFPGCATSVKNGCRSHELKGPLSWLSRHMLNTRLCVTLLPPPNPSFTLNPARGPLKQMLSKQCEPVQTSVATLHADVLAKQ